MGERQSEAPLDLSATVEDAKTHDLKRKTLHEDSGVAAEKATDPQDSSGSLAGPIVKRLKKLRCEVCKQKTGLASSYTCRCGSNFCARHRYAELHQCSFDYRGAGRDFLRKMHPLIRPQKIDKI